MTSIEAIQGYLASQTESLAQCAEAVASQADALESLATRQEAIQQEMARLADSVERIEALVGNFVRETERLRSDVRKKLVVGDRG